MNRRRVPRADRRGRRATTNCLANPCAPALGARLMDDPEALGRCLLLFASSSLDGVVAALSVHLHARQRGLAGTLSVAARR